MSQTQILHLSDMHITRKGKFDRSVVLDPLIERISLDKQDGFRPELLIVTGDVTLAGKKAEYTEAQVFLEKLYNDILRIPKKAVYI